MSQALQMLQLEVIDLVVRHEDLNYLKCSAQFVTKMKGIGVDSLIRSIREVTLITLHRLRREAPACQPAVDKFFCQWLDFTERSDRRVDTADFATVVYAELKELIEGLKTVIKESAAALGRHLDRESWLHIQPVSPF